MILAIDVGNTNIVLGSLENGEIINVARIRTERDATWAEYAMKLRLLLDMEAANVKFEGAVLASVVPEINDAIKTAVKKVVGVDCMVIGPGIRTGMNVRIDDPASLGADIVVGCVAAIKEYGAPCIVMDLGTATTICAVDANNAYLGGAIIPGVRLSFNALTSGTSLLPAVSISAPAHVISTNTIDCMQSGAVYGTASMIDGMIDRMEKELGTKCKVIASGGLASCIVPCCNHEIVIDDDLLLKGIWILWEKNK